MTTFEKAKRYFLSQEKKPDYITINSNEKSKFQFYINNNKKR